MFRSSRRNALGALPVALLTALVAGEPLRAQPSGKLATAVRLTGATPRIDGRLDDAAWAGIAPLSDFEQQRPIEGAEPSERTEVRIRYDDDAIFVGARMFRERPSEILRAVTRRDGSANAEQVQVTFDTYRDRRTGYAFILSAAGVRGDFHHSRDAEGDGREYQYDPVWEGAASVDSLGWTAEMRIPFSQLRYPNASRQDWGFQVSRWMPDKNEDVRWVMVPAKEVGYLSHFGTVTGIDGIRSSRPVELMPYVAMDATRAAVTDAANPFRDPTKARAGLDAKFGIGSNLTVDATINPDFGQVEADPAEVNLSAFETIVDERRPFFTEGAQLFRVDGPNYFYSRRVGAPPHLGAAGDYVDQPRSSTILGAAKLTGRTASRLSVAALLAVTDRAHARAFWVDSNRTDRVLVEPRTEYATVRLLQEIGSQASNFGGMLTAMRRELGADTALTARLTNVAFSGGVDWRISWKQQMYAITGYAGFSHVEGDSLAIARIQRSSAHYFQRPDGGYLGYNTARRALSGYTASIRADKDAGRRILWGAQVSTESQAYEVNDLGRLQSADDIDYNADIQIRETEPGRYLRNWRLGFVTRGSFNYGGNRNNEEWQQNTTITFLNFWSVNFNTRFRLETFDDALTRGGPLMRTPFSWGQEYRLNSASGGRTSWRAGVNWNADALGGWRNTVSGGLTLRPAPRWQLSFEPSYQVSTDARQYLTTVTDPAATATYGARYLFAYVDRVTTSVRTRLNYAFSPSLTLEGYAEPFAASGRFHGLGELRAPRTSALRVYGTEGTTISRSADGSYSIQPNGAPIALDNRDFNVLSLRSNLVLRWEWSAGSTLFVVWQQNRREADATGESVRVGDLFNTARAGGDNYLALKLSYWLPIRGRS